MDREIIHHLKMYYNKTRQEENKGNRKIAEFFVNKIHEWINSLNPSIVFTLWSLLRSQMRASTLAETRAHTAAPMQALILSPSATKKLKSFTH